MKTIQCAYPPHHHNGFVATCGQWWSSRIVSDRTNRGLNKHQARSVNILTKTEIGSLYTECSASTNQGV